MKSKHKKQNKCWCCCGLVENMSAEMHKTEYCKIIQWKNYRNIKYYAENRLF